MCDIVTNVKPTLCLIFISIVAFEEVNPCDLWVVSAQANSNGNWCVCPLYIGEIGIKFKDVSSNGIPKKIQIQS